MKDYKLSFSIDYNGRNCNEKVIREFWIQKIPYLREDSRLKIRKRVTYNSNLENNFGVLKARVSNTVLKTFILRLLAIVKKLALKKKQYAIFYLGGLLAGEGHVDGRSILRQISIGCSHEKEKSFIRKLLKMLRFNFYESKDRFVISGWNSFYILYKEDAFKIRQVNNYSKRDRFLLGFRNHQRTQKLFRLQRFEKKEFTAKEWQETFGLKRYISAHKYLRSLIEENILLFNFKKDVKYHYINPKAKPFLEIIWRLKDYKPLII